MTARRESGGAPEWTRMPLRELSRAQWESLCDRCALCCRLKEEDATTGEIRNTHVACRLLDIETGRCRDYGHRRRRVPDCIKLTPENVPRLKWLPASCAYRLLAEGRELPCWHPLVTGDPDSAHKAGFSVRDRVISESDLVSVPHA
jgi:uncharacterized cysteine cluster protein YcgN (CxxCxxCC family)